MSLSAHQSCRMKNDEWLTPPEIVRSLGAFDLDPCSPAVRPWDTALNHYHKGQNGLAYVWKGRVWLNPPFGNQAIHWMLKMASHRNGIALLPARTETKLFFSTVWSTAKGILFLEGRPHFHYVDGARAKANSGAPICLIAYSWSDFGALEDSGLKGRLVKL